MAAAIATTNSSSPSTTTTAAPFPAALGLQSDKLLGLTLACAAGLVTVSGALVVYSSRLTFLWAPRSQVVALGLATGGVLCFTLSELLPAAQRAFAIVIANLLAAPTDDDESSNGSGGSGRIAQPRARTDGVVLGLAALVLACAFAIGVIMVWVMDTLCMYCVLPTTLLRTRRARDPTQLTTTRSTTTATSSPSSSSFSVGARGGYASPRRTQLVLGTSPQDDDDQQRQQQLHVAAATKELLYKTGTAKVIAFSVQNIPEGMILCIATVERRTLGILFASTLALLNVTQGMALAGLLTQASGYRWRAVLWCVLSALALPLGGFLGWGIFLNTELDALSVGVFYALAGGILVGLCLTQILGVCYNYKAAPEGHPVTASVLGGVVFVAALRLALALWYDDEDGAR